MWIDCLLASVAGRLFRWSIRLGAFLGHHRAGELLRFRGESQPPQGPFDLWVHCSSHGEWETARPFVQHYRQQAPEGRILVTFFSPSGRHASIPPSWNVAVCSMPWDVPSEVDAFLESVRPKRLFFIQYDLWPALVCACRRRSIPWGVLNARWSPSLRWTLPLWKSARWITVQTDQDVALWAKRGISTFAAGDLRLDNVCQRVQAISEGIAPSFLVPDRFAEFNDARGLVVCGSIWPEDAPLILPLIARFPEYKWLLVPHDVHESSLRFWESKIPVPHLRWSELDAALVSPADRVVKSSTLHPENARAVVVDRMGVLFPLYSMATRAYVGGGRSGGQHNFWEPLAWGVPTAIAAEGLETHRDALDAVRASFLFPGADAKSIAETWNQEHPVPLLALQKWMRKRAGAAERTWAWLRSEAPAEPVASELKS